MLSIYHGGNSYKKASQTPVLREQGSQSKILETLRRGPRELKLWPRRGSEVGSLNASLDEADSASVGKIAD